MIKWLSLVLGLFFMLAAFFTTGIRGAFSRGEYGPITLTGRILIFLIGLVMFMDGLLKLLRGA